MKGLTYIPLEPEFNAEQSLLGNHGLKMSGFWDAGGQSHQWHHHISNLCYYFSKYVNLCTMNLMSIKIFLEQRCTFFWWRSHSSVSSTSYIASFQNAERSRVQICIFKGFIYRYLMLAALQTLLFTSMFDSAMHAFEAFLCMRIMPTLSFCQNSEKVFCQIRFSTVLKWYYKAESIATQCGGQVYRCSSICHHQ